MAVSWTAMVLFFIFFLLCIPTEYKTNIRRYFYTEAHRLWSVSRWKGSIHFLLYFPVIVSPLFMCMEKNVDGLLYFTKIYRTALFVCLFR